MNPENYWIPLRRRLLGQTTKQSLRKILENISNFEGWDLILVALRWVKYPYSSYFYFDLLLFTKSACVKVIFSCTLRCSVKEAAILLLSWSTLYRAFSKCIVSWHKGFYFELLLLSQSACLKVIYSGCFRCSAKKAVILLFPWGTLFINIAKCIVS